MIEEILPGNKTKVRILSSIYESEGINITALIHKVKASPNLILQYANTLIDFGVLKENKLRGPKKVHMRILKPNLRNEIGKAVFYFIESEKRAILILKYKALKPYFDQLEELCTNRNIVIIVYGSYARLAATAESDIDLLFIGKIDKATRKRIKEIFITLEAEPSIKIETATKFLEQKQKPLYQNILKEHVVICGGWQFMNLLQKVYE